MSDTFTLRPDFLSLVTPASGLFLPNGFTNPLLRGLDGNHYIVTKDSAGAAILSAESGSKTTISLTTLRNDLASFGVALSGDYVGFDTFFAAEGTPYFYVFSSRPSGADHYIGAILYKVVSDGLITAVGGLNFKTHNVNVGFLFEPASHYGFRVINNELLVLGAVGIGGIQARTAVYRLPLAEEFITDLSAGAWDAYYEFTPLVGDFFAYANLSRSGQSVGTLVDLDDGRYGILVYIGKAEYDYISAHPGVNAQWDAITAPGVFWCLSTDAGLTDVSSEFDILDVKTHLDGSSSTNVYDDYVAPGSFVMSGTPYLVFARSYTQSTDLEPLGTYARVRVYSWNGATATAVFDRKTSLFDPVADCGVTEINRFGSYPEFVSLAYDSTDRRVYYIWYGQSGTLDFDYVFGGAIDAVHTETDYFFTFSEFNNPSFTDWQTADPDALGAAMTSTLTTFYMMSDDTMLWMQAPYIHVYVENGEDVALNMQTQWDWSDDSLAHKWSRTLDVYRDKDGLVSISQNRIRGKGRAFRLLFTSDYGKDFNLLSWTVEMSKNTRY